VIGSSGRTRTSNPPVNSYGTPNLWRLRPFRMACDLGLIFKDLGRGWPLSGVPPFAVDPHLGSPERLPLAFRHREFTRHLVVVPWPQTHRDELLS
jgi:hypothetical protein